MSDIEKLEFEIHKEREAIRRLNGDHFLIYGHAKKLERLEKELKLLNKKS